MTGNGAGEDFVSKDSVVRRIWGDADMVLLVFAGGAAEFALNRAVDWLFFTGKLPADPLGRLFSTASYSQQIVFADVETAEKTFARIRSVHEGVERARGERIPDWAHRDVLYMLIDYSERAHEMLARPLTHAERIELYDVFRRVGAGLGIPGLPETYSEWREDREVHLQRDLIHGESTSALYTQYRAHLGTWRFRILRAVQSVIVPASVLDMLGQKRAAWIRPLLRLYSPLARTRFKPFIRYMLMPSRYLAMVNNLDSGRARQATVKQTQWRRQWELLKAGS